MIQFLRREAATLLAASACAVASALPTGGLALALGEVAIALRPEDTPEDGSDRFLLATLALALALLARASLHRFGAWLAERAAERNVARLRTKVHAHLVRLPIETVHQEGMTRLGTRLGQESLAARPLLGPLWVQLLAQCVSLLVLLGVAAATWPLAAILGYLALPALTWVGVRLSRHTRRAWREAWHAHGRVTVTATEDIAHLPTWRSADVIPWLQQRFEDRVDQSRLAMQHAQQRRHLGGLALHALTLLGLLLAGLWLSLRTASGALGASEAARLLAAAALTVPPAAALAEAIHGVGAALAPFERLMALLQTPTEPSPLASPPALQGPLVLRDAVVQRGGRTALHGVSVSVAPGEILAVTGPNGAGKSTLLLTMAGLLPLTEGELRVGDTAIHGPLRPHWWRRVGWLGPEAALLADTIAANVALGAAPDTERVVAALRDVGLGEWLEARGGPEALLQEAGEDLSSGERRRLDIARAIYHDHRVMLLDEPGSHLDEETLHWLRQRIVLWAREGRAVVLGTHDPRLLQVADRVVRLRAGRLDRTDEAPPSGPPL